MNIIKICSISTNKMHTRILKLIYMHTVLLHVSAKHVVIFREVKYKGCVKCISQFASLNQQNAHYGSLDINIFIWVIGNARNGKYKVQVSV
jgi:hypothetical protein